MRFFEAALRIGSYGFRAILSLLMAIPTAAAVYQIANPRSMIIELWKYRITLTDWFIDEVNRAFLPIFNAPIPNINLTSRLPSGWFDWGQYLIMIIVAFLIFMGLYSSWKRLPLMALLSVPLFEGLRYWRAPYAEELALQYLQLLCLQPIWLTLIVMVGVIWFLARRYSRTTRHWRQTAALTVITLTTVFLIAWLTPAHIAFDPRTTAHPGTVWLAALVALWFVLNWFVSRTRAATLKTPEQQLTDRQRRLGVR